MPLAQDLSEHLNPSKLGTKEYWEQAYDIETQNFSSNPADEGQIWFSESEAEGRILSYLTDEDISPTASFLDVGTGNGHLLFELIEEGKYEGGDLVGIDYSPKAVALAQKIAEERGLAEKVKFYVSDCIQDDLPSAEWVPRTEGEKGFDIVLDKGTFDAISLSNELLEDGNGRIYESYSKKIVGVMKHGGLLMVTSCNWTEEELKRKLLVAEGGSLFPGLVGNGANEDWRQIWSIMGGYHIHHSPLGESKVRLSLRYVFARNSAITRQGTRVR